MEVPVAVFSPCAVGARERNDNLRHLPLGGPAVTVKRSHSALKIDLNNSDVGKSLQCEYACSHAQIQVHERLKNA